jgi:hypothetical protein
MLLGIRGHDLEADHTGDVCDRQRCATSVPAAANAKVAF